MYWTMDATSKWAVIYYVLVIFFGAIFLVDLAIGVVAEAYEDVVTEEEGHVEAQQAAFSQQDKGFGRAQSAALTKSSHGSLSTSRKSDVRTDLQVRDYNVMKSEAWYSFRSRGEGLKFDELWDPKVQSGLGVRNKNFVIVVKIMGRCVIIVKMMGRCVIVVQIMGRCFLVVQTVGKCVIVVQIMLGRTRSVIIVQIMDQNQRGLNMCLGLTQVVKPTPSFILTVGKQGGNHGAGQTLWRVKKGLDEEEDGRELVPLYVAACRVLFSYQHPILHGISAAALVVHACPVPYCSLRAV
jgi:Ion transport protein